MNKIPINPKAREALNQMKEELGSELGINDKIIDKGKLPSRLFSYNNKNSLNGEMSINNEYKEK
ncbi:small, acid-soluble spore protein, alpha/beta type [Tepidibacter aestuarii]|uniref:small, acid-soluble spore protein, alpha/beta type n=1 Tax=Tepidibacter aestuarii TaxID=2925782 RepID=UPI0020C07506|nr:small, acid-soluble spore protein, alpha/beta type [Tepidibacter aestuarii]CAH2214798.1 protein of unknown function [Tepidibacter aestuarii]